MTDPMDEPFFTQQVNDTYTTDLQVREAELTAAYWTGWRIGLAVGFMSALGLLIIIGAIHAWL